MITWRALFRGCAGSHSLKARIILGMVWPGIYCPEVKGLGCRRVCKRAYFRNTTTVGFYAAMDPAGECIDRKDNREFSWSGDVFFA